jgi:putative ABC transport system permease protein
MKDLYRHYSTWLLTLGIVVSLVAFLNGTNIYRRIKTAISEVNSYQYQYSYLVMLYDCDDVSKALDSMLGLYGNISVTDCTVFLDDMGAYHECEILIKQDEELTYPIEQVDADGDVVIGKALEEYTFEKEGKQYILIDGEEVRVAGYVSSDNSGLMDNKIIFDSGVYKAKSLIGDGGAAVFELGSNCQDLGSELNDFYLENVSQYNLYYEKIDNKYIDVSSSADDEKFYMIIAAFAVINCITISELWIERRKNEIVIKKLFGFSGGRIFRMLYGQMLAISGVATVAVLIIQSIISAVNDDYAGISLYKLACAAVFWVVSAMVVVMLPVYKASHYKLNRGLEA